MANSATAEIIIQARDQASAQLQGLSRTLQNVGTTATAVGRGLTIGVTLPIVAVGTAAGKMAMDFDSAMMGVNSVLKLSGGEFQTLKSDVLDFSTTTSKSATDVAVALRGIVSSGFEAGDAMGILRVAVDAAGNMMTDTATTTYALTSTLRAFGMEATSVTHVADVLQTAANNSAIVFDQLTTSIGTALGSAAAAGVSFEETAAALMTITDAGYSTAIATTNLNALISALLKPTDDLSSAIASWGYESGEAALEAIGLQGVMGLLIETTGGSASALATLTGNQRAYKGAVALAREGGIAFADSLDEVSKASLGAGEHAAMADVRHQSWAYTLTRLKSEVEVVAINLGNVLMPAVVDAARVAKDFATVLTQIPPPVLESAVKIALLAAAIGPVIFVIGKMVTAIGALITIGGTLIAVVQAMAGVWTMTLPSIGAYITAMGSAATTTLGFSAAAGAVLIPLAALAAAVVAVTMAVRLHNEVQEQTTAVQSAWSAQLRELAVSEGSAEQAMYSYRDSQAAVARAYEEGGIVAQLFIDKQNIAGASTEELTAMVETAATSYADYRAGMALVNAEIEANNAASQAAAGGMGIYKAVVQDSIPVLDEYSYGIMKNQEAWTHASDAVFALTASEQLAEQASRRLAQSTEEMTGSLTLSWGEAEKMIGALEAVGVAERQVADISHDLAVEYEKTTDLMRMKEDALILLASAYEAGEISQETFREAGERLLTVMDDSVDGYADVADAVTDATGSFYDLGEATGELPDKIHEVAQAALDNAAAAEEMAERQKAAWETFAQSIEGAVGQALKAYKSGNTEMLAEQQRALAEMLWNQTDTMLGMHQITENQAMAMKSAIAGEYGVMVDDTQVATTTLLGMFRDWETGAGVTAEDIMGYLGNIGSETEAMVNEQEASIKTAIFNFEALGSNIDEQVGLTAGKFATMEADVAGLSSEYGTKLDEMGTAFGGVQGDVEIAMSGISTATGGMETEMASLKTSVQGAMATAGASATTFALTFGGAANTVIGLAGQIKSAIANIPATKTITITATYSGPPELELQSPRFAFEHALESATRFASENPIDVQTGDTSALSELQEMISGIVENLIETIQELGFEAEGAGEWGEAIEALMDGLQAGLDLLTGIADYVPVADGLIQSFMSDFQAVTETLMTWISDEIAPTFDTEVVEPWGDILGDLMDGLAAGLELLTGLSEYSTLGTERVQEFVSDFTTLAEGIVTWIANTVAPLVEADVVAPWGEVLEALMGGLLAGLEVLAGLQEWQHIGEKPLSDFIQSVELLLGKFAQSVAMFDQITSAEIVGPWATLMEDLLAGLLDGVKIMTGLQEWVHLGEKPLSDFIQSVELLLGKFAQTVVWLANTVDAEIVAPWAALTADLLGGLLDGMEIMVALREWQHIGERPLTDFIQSVELLLGHFAVVVATLAGSVDAEIVAPWVALVGDLMGGLADGLEVLAGLREYTAISTQTVYAFASDLLYMVDTLATYLAQLSGRIDAEVVEVWGDAIDSLMSGLGDGLEVLTGLVDYSGIGYGAITRFTSDLLNLVDLLIRGVDWVLDAVDTEVLEPWGDAIDSLMSGLGDGLELLTGLTDYSGIGYGAITRFTSDLLNLIDLLVQGIGWVSDAVDTEVVEVWGDTIDSLMSSLGDGLELLADLSEYATPGWEAIETFTSDLLLLIGQLAAGVVQINDQIDATILEPWGDAIDSLVSGLVQGVEALASLVEYTTPGMAAVEAFTGDLLNLITRLGTGIMAIAGQIDLEIIEPWGEAVDNLVGGIAEGAEALVSLIGYITPGELAIETFVANLLDLIAQFGIGIMTFADQIDVGVVEPWGEAVGGLVSGIADGVGALVSLTEYVAIGDDAIRAFTSDLFLLVVRLASNIAWLEGVIDVEIIAPWGEAMGALLSGLGDGVSLLIGLLGYSAVGDDTIREFTRNLFLTIVRLVSDIAQLDTLIDVEIVAPWGDAIDSLLGGLGDGLTLLLSLSEYTAVGDTAITTFVADLIVLVDKLAVAIVALDTYIDVEILGPWGDAIGSLLSGVADGFTVLQGLTDYVAIGDDTIDTFVVNLETLIGKLAAFIERMAATYDLETVAPWIEVTTGLIEGIATGVETLQTIAEYVPPTEWQFEKFQEGFELLLTSFYTWATGMFATSIDESVVAFSDTVGTSLDTLKKAADLFSAMADMGDVPLESIALFVEDIEAMLAIVADMADRLGVEILGKAGDYATHTGDTFSKLKDAVGVLKTLQDPEWSDVAGASMQMVADDMLEFSEILASMTDTFETDVLTEAQSLFAAVVAVVDEVQQAIATIGGIDDVPTLAGYDFGVSFITNIIAGIDATMTTLTTAIAGLEGAFSLSADGYSFGYDFVSAIRLGIRDRLPDLEVVLEYLAGLFPASPAKHGPLRKKPDWTFLGEGLPSALAGINTMLVTPQLGQPVGVTVSGGGAVAGNRGGGDLIVKIENLYGTDREAARKFSRMIADDLRRQGVL